MIWHIFKKDARLLWWLTAGIAALRFAEVVLVQSVGQFSSSRQLMNLIMYLSAGVLLGVVFATCAVVHQDSIPGVRGAIAAGMECLGFSPSGDNAALRSIGATLFHSMFDLPALLRARLRYGSGSTGVA